MNLARRKGLLGLVLTAGILIASGWPGRQLAASPDRPDVVVADFEGETYGSWRADGAALGTAPARGTLPGQMDVTGFEGRGLVNSFHGGDSATGTLTSPPYRIERPFINFLIGGGGYRGTTCLDLLVDDKVVRTATGPNDRPGGSERLDWSGWDVREFLGRDAIFRVVDRRTEGWGHINVDQIVQSDRRRGVQLTRRELVASERYLHLPVKRDAPMRRVRVVEGGRAVREFDIKLGDRQCDFEAFLDLAPFQGKTLTIETQLPQESTALEAVKLAGEVPNAQSLYDEPTRPQFHFTSRRGWLNDPNGLVWFAGEYHLFYQHNPYGWDWGNMHWGHAVSRDLVHWAELPIALYPREYGDWCFSGSAVVDEDNASAFGDGAAPPLVAAFTSTGRGECIVYSRDRGHTWAEYAGNPVVKHDGRDPRLLWHQGTKRWIMAVYDETGGRRAIAFYSSSDFKKWTFESRIDGYFECPELFELEIDGDSARRLWVLYAADGEYQLGQFDGHRFEPRESGKFRTWYGNFYASQTFSNAPDGRRIQIGWANGITFPGAPFNQQMTVSCELSLRTTKAGPRLFARPVRELAALRTRESVLDGLPLITGENVLAGAGGDLLDIELECEHNAEAIFTLNVGGSSLTYDGRKNVLICGDVIAPFMSESKTLKLRLLCDRRSMEVFADDGRVAISRTRVAEPKRTSLSLVRSRESAPVKLIRLRVKELRSAWK